MYFDICMRQKKISERHPPPSLQPKYFLFRKERKMQNVLKRKNMYLYEKIREICSFGPVS